MRTTLTIDDDLIVEVRRRAEEDGTTIGQTVSDLLRQALEDDSAPITYPDGFQPLPLRPGQPRITMELVNRLRDELP